MAISRNRRRSYPALKQKTIRVLGAKPPSITTPRASWVPHDRSHWRLVRGPGKPYQTRDPDVPRSRDALTWWLGFGHGDG